ncbi:hypothetical protein LTS18_004263 [Coniosporium uncinatum]|uniref:Uncharacterized protein n=1 Tax=Coniosporium uncinatum TaxID=93489 RepID=A0ACC3E0B0_9PEZI|nr:hypothetical protein LTS18_004263 [Coniosporium uncinatum]
MWGVLPSRYLFDPNNMRWGLGAYDICFKNKPASTFFSLGQTLPTQRLRYSPHGGLFQPTLTQCIRLLSRGPFSHHNVPSDTASLTPPADPLSEPRTVSPTEHQHQRGLPDPFTDALLTYSTTGTDTFPAPSAYASRAHSWIHIFPEGKIHQHPQKIMRYFKWGVARLILESEPCPDVVPVWVEGLDDVMWDGRGWPRWLPRAGKDVSVTFGERVDVESRFGDLRERWKRLVEHEEIVKSKEQERGGQVLAMGELTDTLKYGEEAVELRKECTMRVREEVLRLRRGRGHSDEDPKAGYAETWALEGPGQQGVQADGSRIRDV